MSDTSTSASTGSLASDRYRLLEVIGRGSFGEVYRGVDTSTDREVAIKAVDLDDIGDELQDIQQEISMLRTCRSPNIVEYYGAVAVPGTARLLIAMELMAVSVADLVSPDTGGAPLPEPHIAYILREVLNALVYLHSEHRIHRDVKAANVLLSKEGMVKVSDFGVSAQLCSTVGFKRRTFVGSPLWMAPEVIEQSPDLRGDGGGGTPRPPSGEEGYDEAADIWSLGITAIEMALGEPPRSGVSSFRLLFLIVREPPPQLDGPFSTELKEFVWQCLKKDPTERPAAMDLLMHPFVAGAERPTDLPERISAFVRTRPHPSSARPELTGGTAAAGSRAEGSGGGGGGGGWDFGTVRAATARPKEQQLSPSTAFQPPAAADRAVSAAAVLLPAMEISRRAATPPAANGALQPGRHIEIPEGPASPGLMSASASSRPVLEPPSFKQTKQADRPPPSRAAALQRATSAAPAAGAAAGPVAAALARLQAAPPLATAAALADALSLLNTSACTAADGSAAARTATASSIRPGGALPPDLGPLGNFLLGRWEDAAAHQQAAGGQ